MRYKDIDSSVVGCIEMNLFTGRPPWQELRGGIQGKVDPYNFKIAVPETHPFFNCGFIYETFVSSLERSEATFALYRECNPWMLELQKVVLKYLNER